MSTRRSIDDMPNEVVDKRSGMSDDLKAEMQRLTGGRGVQRKYQFPNGYGASVIDDGYGAHAGLYELAVIGPDGHLAYDTPITDDVLGWLTEAEVVETLVKIEALPAVAS